MRKTWSTIRYLLAIAMLITSVQSVMAQSSMSAVTAGDHQSMNMAVESDTGCAEETAADDCVPENCCTGMNCEQMSGNCGSCVHISALILPRFHFSLARFNDNFTHSNSSLPDLPPLPPVKPPV